jgi:hypothetical protein
MSKRDSGVRPSAAHDQAFVKEGVRHAHGGFQHATRIAAQVEHEPSQRVAARLEVVLHQVGERGDEIVGRRIAELRDPHVTVFTGQRFGAHGVHVHFAAFEREQQRLRLACPADREPHARAGGTSHARDGFLEAVCRHGRPSTARIASPACTPARAAGEPSIGVTTTTRPSSADTSIPTPE